MSLRSSQYNSETYERSLVSPLVLKIDPWNFVRLHKILETEFSVKFCKAEFFIARLWGWYHIHSEEPKRN